MKALKRSQLCCLLLLLGNLLYAQSDSYRYLPFQSTSTMRGTGSHWASIVTKQTIEPDESTPGEPMRIIGLRRNSPFDGAGTITDFDNPLQPGTSVPVGDSAPAMTLLALVFIVIKRLKSLRTDK
jgi:hypothetical protein